MLLMLEACRSLSLLGGGDWRGTTGSLPFAGGAGAQAWSAWLLPPCRGKVGMGQL